MTRIKMCGLTQPTDAAHAESVGADYLGVILAGGPRLLTVERAAEVLGLRRTGIARAAVFGPQTIDETVALADVLDLDVIQLHGDPSPEFVQTLQGKTARAIWPVLRVEGKTLPAQAIDLANLAGAIVLDAKVVGHLGGTGVALDWEGLADSIRELKVTNPAMTLVLAGGLRATNVGAAMALLQPDVVDVSSGVEVSPGVKDWLAMERFVSAVMTARESRK